MTISDVIDPGDEPGKDRRLPGGGALERTDDDALAERTEGERVEAGLEDYDPADVPSATGDEPASEDAAPEETGS